MQGINEAGLLIYANVPNKARFNRLAFDWVQRQY